MGNEHFWQVPRAKGVRTQHHAECTARKQLVGVGASSGREHSDKVGPRDHPTPRGPH